MKLSPIELIIHWAGGLSAFTVLGILLAGILSGVLRPAGRTTGRAAGGLRSAAFYLVTTALFLALSAIFWKPLPLTLPSSIRWPALVGGVLIYFPGMFFLLWGRLTLGEMYFVSTTFGAQLYNDHELITQEPYAIVRHPMYLGLIASAVGSLLLYLTWTTAAFALFAPFILFRARREEQALAAEFGEEWQAYCRRVPGFLPRLKRENPHGKDERA